MNKTFSRVALLGLTVAAGAANAAAGDVDISAITASQTQIALVGGAVFAVAVGIKLFKWIRRAL